MTILQIVLLVLALIALGFAAWSVQQVGKLQLLPAGLFLALVAFTLPLLKSLS